MVSTPIMKNITKYFKISPDYGGCLGYYSEDSCSYGCENDTLELEGYEDTPFHVPGLTEWCEEWEVHCERSIKGLPPLPSSELWTERGLYLAQMLRQIMPDEIALLYDVGDGVKLIDKITCFFLSADTCFSIGDTNYYTVTYFGDVAEIADFEPIPLPGLDKWWHDYDNRVNYADTCCTDKEFDWVKWCMQGMHYASIIRKYLPESVEVWFRTPFELRTVGIEFDIRFNSDGTLELSDFLHH